MISLDKPDERRENDDQTVIDLSGLELDNSSVDAGVTSGADPSGWDPIDVDGRVDSCVNETAKGGDKSAPAVCVSQDQQSGKSQ